MYHIRLSKEIKHDVGLFELKKNFLIPSNLSNNTKEVPPLKFHENCFKPVYAQIQIES